MSKNIKYPDNFGQHNFENSVWEYFAEDNPVQENSVQKPAKCALLEENKGEISSKMAGIWPAFARFCQIPRDGASIKILGKGKKKGATPY